MSPESINLMAEQIIPFSPITLIWSEWVSWINLALPERQTGISLPDEPGVYEVKTIHSDERLTIGKATSLRRRVRIHLVRGMGKHSTGKRIRANEDPENLLVRWAITAQPAAVEEELHRLYRESNGKLPKYTLSTR